MLAGVEKRFAILALVLSAGAGVPRAAGAGQAGREEEHRPVRHALLVGCSEYPELRKAFPERYERELALRGPVNDVELLGATLERVLGLTREHTTVLAGWREDIRTRPTCANVLAHLERLAHEARRGDQVIVYLAGHGSQQKVKRIKTEEEPDGLEEIFLPADVRPAQEQDHVPNSIRDDELGERVRAIRDAGAEVWLIVDSCHSGTMLRGGSADVRLRGIDPVLLGAASATRGGRAGSAASPSWLDGTDSQGIAAFYGATSYGRAPEMELPYKAPGAEPHGLFTYLLCQELQRAGADVTYGELAERIVAAYQAFPCAITVPTAEGALERELASGLAHEAALVCTLKSGVPFLNQGRLAGLEPGVVLQLFELAQGAERAVARMEITEADLFQARGKLLAGELAAEVSSWRARADARPLGDYRLTLALVHTDGSAAALGELPAAVGTELQREAAHFPLVSEPGAADWWIVLGADGFWLRPGPREGGPDLCSVVPERLLETLAGIQRARNLRRFAGSAFTSEWGDDLEVWIERHGARGWQRLEKGSVLRPGEKIRVRLLKKSDAIYDVNVFYLDANFGAQCLRPASGSPRLEASARERDLTGEQIITDDALGLENVLVFATPRTESSRVIDLRALEQKGLTRGSASPDPFEDLVRHVVAGENTRGAPVSLAGTGGTQSLLHTLRIEWGELGPPAWPGRNFAVERPQRAPTGDDKQGLGGIPLAPPSELPDPWACGLRAALRKSHPEGGFDLLLLGDHEVETVFVDFDAGVPNEGQAAELASTRAFEAEAAFQFGARRLAWYDRADRGAFDLALEDADGDGVAEARWTLEGERGAGHWRRTAPVALPWLSQGYVVRGKREKAEISARLQALQRGK